MYKLFQRMYVEKPHTYKLNKIYSTHEVVRLFAKSHNILIANGNHVVELFYADGKVNIHYDEEQPLGKWVRLVDALYILDKLLFTYDYSVITQRPIVEVYANVEDVD